MHLAKAERCMRMPKRRTSQAAAQKGDETAWAAADGEMGARFVGVLVRSQTATWLALLGLVSAFSCSVFPDEATLPVSNAGSSSGGDSVLPQAGLGGTEGNPPGAGAAGADLGEGGSTAGAGGTPGMGAAPGTGGAPEESGGAGSAGAGTDCANPQVVVGVVTADTWIESAKPNANHGTDKTLSVIGGGQERRALLQVALPAIAPGAVLLRATFSLHVSNAAAGLVARRLALHQLSREVIEARATWLNWNNGNRIWTTAGGDYGPVLSPATLPAGELDATLTFDVTVAVEEALSTQTAELPFIVLETSAPPPAPAELAFTAKEGNASGIPTLIVDYCAP
jgi:hypothetical protein